MWATTKHYIDEQQTIGCPNVQDSKAFLHSAWRLLWGCTEVVQNEVRYPEVEGILGPEPLVADLQENVLQLVSEEGGQG